MYVGLRSQDLEKFYGDTFSDPGSTGGHDEASIAREAMRFYAKLTASAVSNGITYYSWKEQQRVVDTGAGVPGFVDLPGGRFGNVPGDPTGATTFSNPAVEPNGATPPVPTIVRMSKNHFDPALGMVHVATVASVAVAPAVVFHGAHIYLTSDQTFSNASAAALSGYTVLFDSDGFYNAAAPTRLTVPAGLDGKYHVGGQIKWGPKNASGWFLFVQIFISGIGPTCQTVVPNVFDSQTGTIIGTNTIRDVSAGNYFELFGDQVTGGSLAAKASIGTGGGTELWCYKVG